MKSKLYYLALQAGIALAYFALGLLGLLMAGAHHIGSPVWPPAGVALAAVLLLGRRIWPGLLAGGFLTGLATFASFASYTLPWLGAASAIALASALEALLGAWLVQRFAHGRDAFLQPQSVLAFVALAGVANTALAATLAVNAATLCGLLPRSSFSLTWFVWWLADMLSTVVLAPLILVWSRPRPAERRSWPPLAEAAALALLLLLLCGLAFGKLNATRLHGAPLSFLLVPLLVWTALRFGARGTTLANFLVMGLATAGTLHGYGTFAEAEPALSLMLLQNFLAILTVLSLILAADAAQREYTQSGLRASEQRYRELFEASPQPMWVVDLETLRFLAVNEAAVQHYGYSREEFLKMSSADIRPPEDIPALKAAVAQPSHGAPLPRQWRHRKKDGSLIDVEITRQNLVFDGRPATMVCSTNITERVRSAAEIDRLNRTLRHHIEELQLLLNVAPVGIAVARDPQCRVITGNPACAAIFGVNGDANLSLDAPQAAHLPYKVRRLGQELPPADLPMHVAASRGISVRGEELDIAFQDGRTVAAYVSAAPLYDDLGRVRGSLGIFVDLTERKRAELALREANERLRLALSAGKMGTWAVELGQPCKIFVSPELEVMGGLQPGEFPGTEAALFELIHPDDHPKVRRAIAETIRCHEQYEVEFRFLPRLHSLGWLLTRGQAYYDPQGAPVRLAGVAIDITRHKKAELEVLSLNEQLERRVQERTAQLEAINKELEAFCYSVSHDLRAPLRSIRGFSEVLLQRYAQHLDDRGRDFLRRSCDSSRHMDALIDDLLKLSRLGRSELKCQTVNLSALAEAIAAELHESAPERHVQFVIPPNLSAHGDERLLRVVLDNLLRNAWKFTAKQPAPRIEFGFAPDPARAFFVRDNGAGFDMAYAHRLFGVFQRLHTTSEFPGTGIGLATVQRVINRHGGRVWAEGGLNAGATFYFTLPS